MPDSVIVAHIVLIAIPALQPLPHLVLNAANDTGTSV